MGELLYCHEPAAALPYYVEGFGVNLYSLEELCYYIAGNTYLLDGGFMNEELCTWVEKQMRAYRLAGRLREIMRGGSLSEFVLAILEYTAYQSAGQIREVTAAVRQMEEKSEFECSKLRADRLMEKGKYLSSIYEYKRLLDSEDAEQENALLIGNIWHNLGTAYTRLFLFEEAAACYRNAYERNQKRASMEAALHCLLCLGDEEGFVRGAKEQLLDEDGMQKLREVLMSAMESEDVRELEERIEAVREQGRNGQKNEARQAVSDIIFQWKEDYRRSCRV